MGGRCARARAPLTARVGLSALAHQQYSAGRYKDAHVSCEQIYQADAYRTDNLLLLGAIHFQLRNFSECIFYNQQAIRIDPNFAGAPACASARRGRSSPEGGWAQRRTGTSGML